MGFLFLFLLFVLGVTSGLLFINKGETSSEIKNLLGKILESFKELFDSIRNLFVYINGILKEKAKETNKPISSESTKIESYDQEDSTQGNKSYAENSINTTESLEEKQEEEKEVTSKEITPDCFISASSETDSIDPEDNSIEKEQSNEIKEVNSNLPETDNESNEFPINGTQNNSLPNAQPNPELQEDNSPNLEAEEKTSEF